MADGVSRELPAGASWQTIEQAAVALGLSVRTVNRHIQASKLQSRLADGRREVLVILPDLTDNGSVTGEANQTEGQTEAGPVIPPPDPSPGPAAPASEEQPKEESTPPQPNPTHSYTATPSLDIEAQLARADNAADKAELAVRAYQNLARSIETQAESARRVARVAWSIVGVLSVGVIVAVGWTASKLTRAQVESEHLHQQVESAAKTAESRGAELDTLRDRLSEARQEAARLQERAAGLADQQSRKPASRPANPVDGFLSAFSGPGPSDH